MYVSKKVANTAIEGDKVLTEMVPELKDFSFSASSSIMKSAAQSEIERSVRDTLAHFEVRATSLFIFALF